MRPRSYFSVLFVSTALAGAFGLLAGIFYLSRSDWWSFILGVVTIIAAAALISWRTARHSKREFAELYQAAVSRSTSWPAAGSFRELYDLAEAVYRRLEAENNALQSARHELREQRAVLSSMVEGVLAVDTDHRVINLNEAGAKYLNVDRSAEGRSFEVVVRQFEFISFVNDVLASGLELQNEIVMRGPGGKTLLVRGMPLKHESGTKIGALIVFQDVTDVRRLEALRREFIANVSHELRTPITSIKGFVEALNDGALEDPTVSRKFLNIIAKQVNGLNAIIDDLLNLSMIEQQAGDAIPVQQSRMRDVLESALELCSLEAAKRSISITLDCPHSLIAIFNPTLIEQAVVNLIQNAIKYSEENRVVRVGAAIDHQNILIKVTDQGWGISSSELPRIFERFYRVDKARSRKLGGTGLGLAITKHVALAHRGRVGVESEVGQGSVFWLEIPLVTSELPASDDERSFLPLSK